MQPTETSREYPGETTDAPPNGRARRGIAHWRYALVFLIVLGFVLLAILPPLVNVSRFKRRIVTSISTSLGRPVHLDNVSLVLLPFPGFKLENFVVEEAPAFGAEPVIHANNVVATLRFSSLWRRRVEFSKISLQEPSVNLVHMPDGRWNVESILLQAARIPTAPTAQARAGSDPRFPYIEANGARVNIKYGNEKLPLSLTEADFALWLPRPQQWRIRIEGKPTRTDTSASDTGTILLEGTLGHAERFDHIPIDLSAEWKNAPLGEASRVVSGRDLGLRGNLKLDLSAHGTIGESIVKTDLQLRGARRAEFVPPQSLDLQAECQANATETFHALRGIRCSWPPPGDPTQIALTAELSDIHNPAGASFALGSPGVPAATLLTWLRIASPRVSPEVTVSGTLTGSITREPIAEADRPDPTGGHGERSKLSASAGPSGDNIDDILSGHLALKSVVLTGGPIGVSSVAFGEIAIASSDAGAPAPRSQRSGRPDRGSAPAGTAAGQFIMAPTTLTLGGKEPATLEGRFDRHGYSLHLSGNVLSSRLLALASAIPQLGDGLAAAIASPVSPVASQSPATSQNKELPIRIDLISSRPWTGGQHWERMTATAAGARGSARR